MSELSETIGNVMDEKSQEFEPTDEGWQKRWSAEMEASNKMLKKFIDSGRNVVSRYLDTLPRSGGHSVHVNLFTANTQTLRALLYGKIPQVDVKRRFGDPNDKVGRCAAEALRRLLNTDIERHNDGYARALKHALLDRLIPGLGVIRYRYVADFDDDEEVPAKFKTDEQGNQVKGEDGEPIMLAKGYTKPGDKSREDVETDYVFWEDFRWSAGSKIWSDTRWIAYATDMTKKAMLDQWGKAKLLKAGVPMLAPNNKVQRYEGDNLKPDPWSRARVWEIWDREHRKVFWFAEGAREILEVQDDPYQLEGFYPSPEPLFANLTTSALVPRSDYALAEDLYERVDTLSTRIGLLEDAISVRGIYNGISPQIKKLLGQAAQNEMIPCDEWAAFAEKGGVKGNVDWFPLDMVVAALEKLREQRQENIQILFQVTGMSDILRGQAQAGATATEQAIKAKFAGVRVQDFQDEFARFASDGQRIRAEMIINLFDDTTIMSRSNMGFTPDAQLLPQAVQLLRDKFVDYRIQVLPESVSVTDYASMQQERTVLMQTLAQLLQVTLPIGQSAPQMLPYLLQIIQWMFAGFKGASTMEGIFDQAVKAAEGMAQMAMQKASQPPQPSPEDQIKLMMAKMKLMEAQIHAQAEMGKAKADQQQVGLDAQATVAEHQVDMQRVGMEAQADQQKHEMTMAQIEAKLRADAVRSTLPKGSKE